MESGKKIFFKISFVEDLGLMSCDVVTAMFLADRKKLKSYTSPLYTEFAGLIGN